MRLLLVVLATLAIANPIGARAQALPDELSAAGVTRDQWSELQAAVHRIAAEKGVSEPALAAACARMAVILEQGHVFTIDQAITFVDHRADELTVLAKTLAEDLRPSDRTTSRVIEQAGSAVQSGDLDGAHALLVHASDRARAAGDARWGASITAAASEVRSAQLDYLGAASDFAEAAREAPSDDRADRWQYLEAQGRALQFRADVFHETQPLTDAASVYRSALQLVSRATEPDKWAQTQGDLGLVLEEIGEQGNEPALREAVEALRHAQEVATREHDRDAWMAAQNNLGNALMLLAGRWGDEQSLRDAVSTYRRLLDVRLREDDPTSWATNQDNLATALTMLGAREDDGRHFSDSVAAYRKALEVFTRDRDPARWAIAEKGLGATLAMIGANRQTSASDRQAALNEAVATLRSVLAVYPRERDPQGWAEAEWDLGNALQTLGRAGDERSLRDAVAAFTQALTVYGRDPNDAQARAIRDQIVRAQALVSAADLAEAGDAKDGNAAFARHDYRTALRLLMPLAQKGNAAAECDVGLMYASGNGLAEDRNEAVKWFLASAQQGQLGCQTNIGIAYATGIGIQKDYVKAYMWFSRSAPEYRDHVAGEMTPEQIERAKDMAKRCQAAAYKNCDSQ